MIEMNRDPSRRDLRIFGIGLLVVFGSLGGWMVLRGSVEAAILLWAAGALAAGVFFLVPALQRPLYLGWLHAAYPVGWTVTLLIMAVIYYLVLTPIGFFRRLLGRDPLCRRFQRDARTYWTAHGPPAGPERYFRQF